MWFDYYIFIEKERTDPTELRKYDANEEKE